METKELTELEAAKARLKNMDEKFTNKDIYSLIFFCSVQFDRFIESKDIEDVSFFKVLMDKYWRFAGRCYVDTDLMNVIKDIVTIAES